MCKVNLPKHKVSWSPILAAVLHITIDLETQTQDCNYAKNVANDTKIGLYLYLATNPNSVGEFMIGVEESAADVDKGGKCNIA